MPTTPARTIMVQGTGSSVGKSLLATALCRIVMQDGYRVAPFKAQNMSLNSYVTPDGAEIGRAQAVQADAAGVAPAADMNPVLLKPEGDMRSQVVLMGRPEGRLDAHNFNQRGEWLWEAVTRSLDRLRSSFDVVVIEGAGSPAEINLRKGDIVNMEVALHARSPVILVGDIDKGGVFASLYGTMQLLAPEERALVAGMVINKFRGDISILRPGLRQIEDLTGVPVLGVVPYFTNIYVPEEDSPASRPTRADDDAVIDVAVIALPHISNFDDFDPLAREQGVSVRYVRNAEELSHPDMVILPGTKTTVADLVQMRRRGIAAAISDLAADGVPVVGICGGYQMLGRTILDPDGVESDRPEIDGLGLLPVTTTFVGRKETVRVTGSVAAGRGLLAGAEGLPLEGYEIHMGVTEGNVEDHPFRTAGLATTSERDDGCLSADGWTAGTYIHGLFHNTALRRSVLNRLAERKGVSLSFEDDDFSQSAEFDKLAALIRDSIDVAAVYRAAGLKVGSCGAGSP